MQAINDSILNVLHEDVMQDSKKRVVRNACTKNDISTISRCFEAECANPYVFSVDNKTQAAVSQEQSGRCWIFSAMNVLREMVAKKYSIKHFELSQNYIAFYDKLEKANWFMECALKEIDSPSDSEVMRFLLQSPVGDGGQWNMLVSIVEKYGLCPKSTFPETYQSSHTRNMNSILNLRLRKFVADTRKLKAQGKEEEIPAYKEETLKEIYSLLTSCFGVPPKSFTFEYYDEKDVPHAEYNITPLDFYHTWLGVDLHDYVNVIHSPTQDKPYYSKYTVKYLGNVVDGEPISLLNIPLEDFKEAIIAQLKAGELVWFGCDCGKDGDREKGLWDDQAFDYEGTFDMHLDMSKADMLQYGQSAMNHAMVFTGVNLVDGKPTRWKIENSWGNKIANEGYFIASDTWFDKYMYVAAIHKKYLSDKALKALESETKEVAPWDPFGTLAD